MKKELKILLISLGILALILIVFLVFIYQPKEDFIDENQSLSANNTFNVTKEAVLYKPVYSFYNFTDPNENAFSIKIPEGWQASEDSGLIRPYIDAGVKLLVMSSENQQFLYISPYRIYAVPNDLLALAGFPEGSYYDPSGGIANPMLVKSYTEAEDFLNEIVQQLNVETEVIDVIERPDLINENPIPLITKQSAAEITYISNPGPNEIKNKIIAYNYLIEYSGTGIWMASLFGYASPESLFNETEYLVLKSAETFKVNPSWAAKEAQEVNKRLGIISSTQASISDSISSSFEYKSESQDRINKEWSKTILGVEEVYNPETGDTNIVDSGAESYWQDNQGNIWGSKTSENPLPNKDMTKLEIKKGI